VFPKTETFLPLWPDCPDPAPKRAEFFATLNEGRVLGSPDFPFPKGVCFFKKDGPRIRVVAVSGRTRLSVGMPKECRLRDSVLSRKLCAQPKGC